jgi:hypothetical protein
VNNGVKPILPYRSQAVHPAILDARELLRQEDNHWHTRRDPHWRRISKAVDLAPTLTICEALLRGEHVPVDQLDPQWVTRYGIRP